MKNWKSRPDRMRSALFLLTVCVLTTTAATCHVDPEVECKTDVGPLAVPFCEDIAGLSGEKYAVAHAMLDSAVQNFALFEEQDRVGNLQPIYSSIPPRGQVTSFDSAQWLNKEDFVERPRVVAILNSSADYAHGIRSGVSFVVLSLTPKDEWRVVLVPKDPLQPLSVLYNPVFTDDAALMRQSPFVAHIGLEMTEEQWDETLSLEVLSCKKRELRACLVNTKDGISIPSPSTTAATFDDGGNTTDVWVWISERGCICLGTQCHSEAFMKMHGGYK